MISIEPVARPTSLAAALEFLTRVQKRRAVVFLLSDFQAPEARQSLALCNSRHDLIAVSVADPREQVLPDVGFISLVDAETGQIVELDTRHPKVRELFAGRAARRAEKLSAELRKVGVDELAIRTDEDYLKSFRRFLPHAANDGSDEVLPCPTVIPCSCERSLAIALPFSPAAAGSAPPAAEQTEQKPKVAASQVERGPVRMSVTVDPSPARLSDEPTLTLEIAYPQGITIRKPEFGSALGEFVIRDFREPLPRIEGDRQILQQIYTLEPTRAGKFVIDPISITFVDDQAGGADKEHTLETEPITVEVAAAVAQEAPSLEQLHGPADPLPLPQPPGTAGWWIGRRGSRSPAGGGRGVVVAPPEEDAVCLRAYARPNWPSWNCSVCGRANWPPAT